MRLFPDTRRLKWVKDLCLLPGNTLLPHEATAWYTATFIDPEDVVLTRRSVSVTVVKNRFLTWTRTYTRDGLAPPIIPHSSLFGIHEWLPWFEPTREARQGFFRFGSRKYKSIAYLHADYQKDWSEQARRHLKAYVKAEQAGDVKIRRATLEELLPAYVKSQVPLDMQEVFVGQVQRHVAANSESVDIVVVEHVLHGIVAGFVGANCAEAKQSVYLLGFFLPEVEKVHPMMGLVDWWYRRCLELGYEICHFGIMSGPNPLPIEQGIGYSTFKTHFGVTRVWAPVNYWKISR